jgi:pilus assembly protein TadC
MLIFFILLTLLFFSWYQYQVSNIDISWTWWRGEPNFSEIKKYAWYQAPLFTKKSTHRLLQWLISSDKVALQIQKANVDISVESFLGIKSTILQVISIWLFVILLIGGISTMDWFIWGGIFLLGFFGPDIWLQIQAEKRVKKLAMEVPYFIDLFALTIRTGVNIEQAFAYTTQQHQNTLNQLLHKQLQKIQRGTALADVLEQTKKLVDHDEFNRFCLTIQQSKKLGVSLSETLELHSNLMRTRRKQKAEELSRTAGVKITLPLVLFIFPALLLLYLGPGLLQMMNSG